MSPIGKLQPSNISPSNDVLRADRHPLDPLFKPTSVAVVGASGKPGSIGRSVLWNLMSSPFGGAIYPINPKHTNILGFRAFGSLQQLPEVPDLVVLCTPAETVPGLLTDCVALGVPCGIVISSGFKETGEHGRQLEDEIMGIVRGRMRLLGPNCMGVMNTTSGLNATFATSMAKPGSVAFISQSGALCASVLDWSMTENVGFSGFVSVGSMVDINWGDLIDYFGDDPRTRSIVIYMESIGDASSFLSAAREVSLTKPIIVIKAGRTAAASRAAASHTGALTGSDAVLEAAFRRTGVLRVNSLAEIIFMTEALAKQPRPRGNRLCIVSNAGGPGVLATDSLLQGGADLADLSPETLKALDAFLPPAWSHANPIDILADADAKRYAKSIEIAAKDPNIDGMLVILTPQAMTSSVALAEQLKPYAQGLGKPVLASLMGGQSAREGEQILNSVGIPNFHFPDTAAQAFNYMWRYTYNLRGIYETPSPNAAGFQPDHARAAGLLSEVRSTDRTIFTEYESKQLLDAYGIPRLRTEFASTEEEAADVAASVGFPVVLKLHSYTLTHKSDVGGVALNLPDARAVRHAFRQIQDNVSESAGAEHFHGVTVQPFERHEGYELILGSSIDPQFGPVLLFGAGGQLVEVFADYALALPPLNTTLARRLIEQTRICKALCGVRGRTKVNRAALEELMVRFSDMVVQNPVISEIDINPLLATSDRLLALDARIVVHPASVPDADLPRTAIRPYPERYIARCTMRDGEPYVVRPIRPEDEPLVIEFHKKLSERSVYLRYFQPLKLTQRTAHERLTRICFIDYDREMALVAERRKSDGSPDIVAIGRMSKIHARPEAELALLVQDEFQGKGIGTELFNRLIQVGRDERLTKLHANMLGENRDMQKMCRRLNFKITIPDIEDNLVLAELTL